MARNGKHHREVGRFLQDKTKFENAPHCHQLQSIAAQKVQIANFLFFLCQCYFRDAVRVLQMIKFRCWGMRGNVVQVGREKFP